MKVRSRTLCECERKCGKCVGKMSMLAPSLDVNSSDSPLWGQETRSRQNDASTNQFQPRDKVSIMARDAHFSIDWRHSSSNSRATKFGINLFYLQLDPFLPFVITCLWRYGIEWSVYLRVSSITMLRTSPYTSSTPITLRLSLSVRGHVIQPTFLLTISMFWQAWSRFHHTISEKPESLTTI